MLSSRPFAVTVALGAISLFPGALFAEPAEGPTIRYEGRGDRRDRLDAMQGTPFDQSLWMKLSDWTGGSARALTPENTKGKVVLLVTWSSGYKTSYEGLKAAQSVGTKHKDSPDLIVVGVHGRDGFDRAAQVMSEQGGTFMYAHDKDNAVRTALAADVDPDFFLIDRAGRLRYVDIATSSVPAAVDQLLAETPEQAASASAPTSRDGAPDASSSGSSAKAGAEGLIGLTKTAGGVTFSLPEAKAYESASWPTANKGRISAANFQGKKLPATLGDETWLDGLPDTAGKIVVVDFWATWCPPCRKAMPDLDKLYNDLKSDVVVLGISDERESTVKNFLRKGKHSYPQGIDPSNKVASALQVQGIPHVIVLSTDGVVRWQGNPAAEMSSLRAAVNAAIKADPGVQARREAEAAANRK